MKRVCRRLYEEDFKRLVVAQKIVHEVLIASPNVIPRFK
jgi:hypothetical protein